MKRLKLTSLLAILLVSTSSLFAQDATVDDILSGYFENTGGLEAWKELKGMKMTGKLNQGGMEFTLEIVQQKDGMTYTKINLQGQEFMQNVYDGEVLWNTNFQTGKAEKADTETLENYKLDTNDFPDAFLDYKAKGYTVELLGTETFDGAETYKIKLVKEPKTLNGETYEDITYYYFDAEAFIPLASESEIKQGPMAGKIQQVTMSDYQEVDGYYFPFTLSQGIKDGPSSPINISSIEVNPEVDAAVFKYSGE